MKKTLTINLNKTVFNIDEDAYDLLQAYLSDVNEHFKSEVGKNEILSDIEARIAELFTERMGKNDNVINVNDVNAVVEIMGKPSQFSEEDDEDNTQKEKSSYGNERTFTDSKRFYRDHENGLLGGVCSGLAAYLGWDVTLVRIILVVLVFVGFGSIIPIYLVVWLITPKAETTAQKMAMRGEVVNIETIKNKMNDTKSYLESDQFKESANEVGSKFFRAVKAILKMLLTLVGAIFTVVGVVIIGALLFGLIVFLFQPDSIMNVSPEFYKLIEGVSAENATLLILSILFIVGCPIFALIYWSIRARSTTRATSNTPFWVALVLWFAGLFMFLSVGSGTYKVLKENVQKIETWDDFDENSANWTSETRTITEPFYAVDASGVVNVELTYQKDRSVEVSTAKEFLPKIKTKVENGVLKIYSDDFRIKPRINVKIGMDSLTALYSSGATKLRFMNAFPSKTLKVEMSGASNSYINLLDAEEADIDLSGAVKLDMEGVTNKLKLDASGATKIDCDNLKAKEVKIEVSGVSKADVFATENFDGEASGASKINCAGNPKFRKVDVSGTSKIDFEDE